MTKFLDQSSTPCATRSPPVSSSDAADQPEVRWTVKPDGTAFAVEFWKARIVNPNAGLRVGLVLARTALF